MLSILQPSDHNREGDEVANGEGGEGDGKDNSLLADEVNGGGGDESKRKPDAEKFADALGVDWSQLIELQKKQKEEAAKHR